VRRMREQRGSGTMPAAARRLYRATEPACAPYESMGFRKHTTPREYSRRAEDRSSERV
jgi:hypothetical protein